MDASSDDSDDQIKNTSSPGKSAEADANKNKDLGEFTKSVDGIKMGAGNVLAMDTSLK